MEELLRPALLCQRFPAPLPSCLKLLFVMRTKPDTLSTNYPRGLAYLHCLLLGPLPTDRSSRVFWTAHVEPLEASTFFLQGTLSCLFYFWDYNITTPFPFTFSPSKPSHNPSLPSFKFKAFFPWLLYAYLYIHICLNITQLVLRSPALSLPLRTQSHCLEQPWPCDLYFWPHLPAFSIEVLLGSVVFCL